MLQWKRSADLSLICVINLQPDASMLGLVWLFVLLIHASYTLPDQIRSNRGSLWEASVKGSFSSQLVELLVCPTLWIYCLLVIRAFSSRRMHQTRVLGKPLAKLVEDLWRNLKGCLHGNLSSFFIYCCCWSSELHRRVARTRPEKPLGKLVGLPAELLYCVEIRMRGCLSIPHRSIVQSHSANYGC